MDRKEGLFNPVGFRLHQITTEQFALLPEHYDPGTEDVEMSVGLKFGMYEAERMIAVFVKVQFENQGKVYLLAELGHHYQLAPETWGSMKSEDGKLTVPKSFAAHLVVLTIGTLRGFLHAKTESTTLNVLILPTVNVTEMVTKDLELSENPRP